MRPFKLFWGWTKNTSSSPAQGFFSPLLCPKIFPSYLPPPPTSLTSFPTHSISRAWESSWAWVTQSFNETWDTRLEKGGELNIEGMWRGEGKTSTSSQMQKREKKGKISPFFAFFFPLFVFFFLFFYLRRRRRHHLLVSFWNKEGDDTSVSLPSFFFYFFFATNKATTTSLQSSKNFPLLPTSPLVFLCGVVVTKKVMAAS